MNIDVIIASTLGLLLVTLVLVSILLYAKSKLVPSGPVKISINNEVLATLMDYNIELNIA